MRNQDMPTPWRVHAVRLPDGAAPEWLGDGAREVPGAYALPGGLVDAHFHATLDFAGLGLARDRLIDANRSALEGAGVLGARDVGQAPEAPWLVDLQDERFAAARTLLAPPGRYFPGLSEPAPAERVVAIAVAQVRAGARWVKVIADFVGPDGNWLAAPANYPAETMRALVDAVHAEGGRVAAHTTGLAAADAVRAGVDSIEHGSVLGEAAIEEMARRGTAWVPTLWAANKHLAAAPPAFYEAWRERTRALLALALRRGVPVLAGSDETPAGALHLEVAALVETGGLSGAAALRAASTVARRALALPGHPDDLVTYDADPRADPAVLARPVAVVLGGRSSAAPQETPSQRP
jgi:imidazolonepropionase-like amidohydrolase